jgi:hypothetical protein
MTHQVTINFEEPVRNGGETAVLIGQASGRTIEVHVPVEEWLVDVIWDHAQDAPNWSDAVVPRHAFDNAAKRADAWITEHGIPSDGVIVLPKLA